MRLDQYGFRALGSKEVWVERVDCLVTTLDALEGMGCDRQRIIPLSHGGRKWASFLEVAGQPEFYRACEKQEKNEIPGVARVSGIDCLHFLFRQRTCAIVGSVFRDTSGPQNKKKEAAR